ncbi:MBL fold metallo-hydrolase [Flavobacterium plurextorum]|uniref:ComEC/Rec2 family competence protein n=1 Tax=Flavobacterium TaxID=237 RepID=UPI00214DB8A2|nr:MULTISPECIES: MBL fold metallo-hydrolase [Flavobacterium]UUW08363.1 MBL fold metallo-hydrolase [Flavobacterium plurextorum]
MKISIFPAFNGDSILLETEISTILIDGGYVDTYKKHIKPKLKELGIKDKKISHLIVTHIDNDHISGIIKLIEENKFDELIVVENVWHNSFQHIVDIDDGLVFKGKDISELSINYLLKKGNDSKDKNISAVQGSTLASFLKKYNHKWNSEFDNKAISVDSKSEIINNDLTFKILSPNNEKLRELKKYWKKELYIKGFSSDENLSDFNEDAFEYILSLEKEKRKLRKKNVSGSFDIEKLLNDPFIEDDAVTNGSSISFIIEYENLKILFLADSHPSIIIENLNKHFKKEEFPIKFDLIKVAHHGCKNNTSPELLNYIDSENFIFSTNGLSHNHPDEETIARIISRKTVFKRNLYFNYPIQAIASFKKDDLMKEYNFTIIESVEDKPIEINFSK